MKKYYALATTNESTDIYIYGDITSWEWVESDISSYNLAKEIEEVESEVINVYINSYGGEVKEGLAIYNALKRHNSKVITYCDGFACSAASVVFMAGDERIMSSASLLMIHNAWTYVGGDQNELRKQADDLEKITKASVNAYLEYINIDEITLQTLLDEETWITSDEAVAMGFATNVKEEKQNGISQSVKTSVMQKLLTKSKPVTVQVKTEDLEPVIQKSIEKTFKQYFEEAEEKTFIQKFCNALMAEKE